MDPSEERPSEPDHDPVDLFAKPPARSSTSPGPSALGPELLGPGPGSPVVARGPVVARPTGLRRGATALVGVTLAVAFAVVTASENVDQRFVDTVRAQGHAVAPGSQQALLVSGARKICERMDNHSTVAGRRATALSPAEVGAVTAAYPVDTGSVTVGAHVTNCGHPLSP